MVDGELHFEPINRHLTPPRDDAGVVDQHMNSRVSALKLAGSPPDGGLGGQVGRDDVRDNRILRPDFVGDCLAILLIAADQDDLGTESRQTFGGGPTDSPVGSGDDADPADHVRCHARLLTYLRCDASHPMVASKTVSI